MGQRVEAGQVIADGPSTDNGELALGKNLLVAFMPWEGHTTTRTRSSCPSASCVTTCCPASTSKNTSDARDTKLGPEEITGTSRTSNSDEALGQLDERGIIRVGADASGDILVGKTTPRARPS